MILPCQKRAAQGTGVLVTPVLNEGWKSLLTADPAHGEKPDILMPGPTVTAT